MSDSRPHDEITASVAALAAAHDWPRLDLGEVVVGTSGYPWYDFLHGASVPGLLRAEVALQKLG